MGITSLRRYHDDSREVGLTPAPQGSEDVPQEVIDQRSDEERRTEAAEAGKVREFDAKEVANAARRDLNEAISALQGPVGERSVTELAQDVQDAAQALTEAEAAVEVAIAEDDTDREAVAAEAQRKADEEHEEKRQQQAKADADANPDGAPAGANEDGTAPEPDTKHGEIERPARTASTAAWVAYAEADPNGKPFALEARTGLRDEIATHYLGAV